MIKKYLVCGPNVYFSSHRPEASSENETVVEIEMPLEKFWEVNEVLKEVVYLLSSGEPQSEVSGRIKKIYKVCSPYVTAEKDRVWLFDKANE